jgi:hypothetical protein
MNGADGMRGPGPLVRMLKVLGWLMAIAVAVPIGIVVLIYLAWMAASAAAWGWQVGSSLRTPGVLGGLALAAFYRLLIAATRDPGRGVTRG